MGMSSWIAIAAVAVGVPGFVAFVAVLASHARKMKELAIRDKELEIAGSEASLGPALDALRDELTETRTHVAELQERVDFAERLLTAGSPARE